MNEKSLQDDPLIETGKRSQELAEREAALHRDADGPRLGDVYLFREVTVPLEDSEADDTLEWAVIERRPGDGRLLVVPVDDHPFIGSRDLALSLEALGSVANLRCDLGVWLETSCFDPELRTGRVSEHDVGRVRRKRSEISQGRATDSLLEEEIDGDPEYRHWRDALSVACTALPGEVDRINVDPPDQVESDALDRRSRSSSRVLAAAATVVLSLGIGWQIWQLQDALDAGRQRIIELQERDAVQREELETQRTQIESQGEQLAISSEQARRYKELLENTDGEVARQQERIAALERALEDTVQVNVPWIAFTHRDRSVRSGGALTYVLPAGARRVVLALEIVDPEPYERYRLRIVSKDDGEEVFASDELVKLDGRWLRIDLPAMRLREGEYELRVDGLNAGGFRPLEEGDELKIVRRFAD